MRQLEYLVALVSDGSAIVFSHLYVVVDANYNFIIFVKISCNQLRHRYRPCGAEVEPRSVYLG